MTMKEKLVNILGGFLERNKEYAISGNISNGINGNPISNFLMAIDREYGSNESVLYLKSNIGDIKNVNHILVRVIFKNGIIIDFECVGMRL